MVKRYFSRPRKYSYKELRGVVLPGVFFPHFTISTKLLLEFIDSINLKDKSFLELGCGTALLSCLAAQKGAKVTATDINPQAIENAELNAKNNSLTIKTILSDLFTAIPTAVFDYIVINPPYYPKEPSNAAEKAWFCGTNFEYFEKLFASIRPYMAPYSEVFMILSEDCKIDVIGNIASKNGYQLNLIQQRKKWGEKNYIFQLESI